MSRATVDSDTLAGQEIPRRFTTDVDEPLELLGTDTAPNPQEMLMAVLNACVMVGYVAGAAVNGITLSKLEIETVMKTSPNVFNLSKPAAVEATLEVER